MHRGGLSEKRCSFPSCCQLDLDDHILAPQFPYLLKVRVGSEWYASHILLLEQQNAFLKQDEREMTLVCGIAGWNSIKSMLLCHLARWISLLL